MIKLFKYAKAVCLVQDHSGFSHVPMSEIKNIVRLDEIKCE